MIFHGYALYKGWNKMVIYLDEIQRVSLRMEGKEIVRYQNHFYPTHPVSKLSEIIADNGVDNFRFKLRALTPEFPLLPIVINWEMNFGIYPEAYGI